MLKVLIIDDDTLTRERIKTLLHHYPELVEARQATSGCDAVIAASDFAPEIIFFDIAMPGISGVELAARLPQSSALVVITAHPQYAVAAFELNAVDYLLKPFEQGRFATAMARAQLRVRENKGVYFEQVTDLVQDIVKQKSKHYKERLVIRDPGRIRLVDVDQIHYITGAGNYVELHLAEGKTILHRETLTMLEGQLDPDIFARIHRSTIVRRSCITELRPNDKGDYAVILDSGDALTLSRRNKAKLVELTR